jgi:putative addiction module component (TIGR02574 family)
MSTDYSPLFALNTAEKLRLVEALWDDIATSPRDVFVPQWHLDELQRRKAEFLKHPENTFTWDEVKKYVLERNG